jgi:O-antigen/teichoic acid export membrane protein
MGSAQFFGQLITWTVTILVIRLLEPSDYGVMAMATVFLSFLLMLSDLGIGAAIVQADEINQDDARYIQGFIVLFNMAGFVLTIAGSSLIAAFFNEPRLVPILNVLSSCFLLMVFYVYPQAMLQRELHFDRKAKVDFLSLTIGAFVSLAGALLGYGVWALVAGAISIHAVRAVGFNIAWRGAPIPRFSLSHASTFLRFGGAIVASRVLWFLYSNLDIAIAGKLLGNELVGIYSVALTLSWIPLRKVMPIVTQVSFSAFSRIQNDRERVEKNVLLSIRYSFALFLPVFWGMALVAPDGIPIALGEQWVLVVVPLQLICLILPLRAIVAILSPAVFGIGKPLVNVVNAALVLPLMALAFFLGARSGLVGLASAWLFAYPIAFAIITMRSFPVLGVSWRSVWQSLRISLLAAAVMVGAVVCVQFATREAIPLLRLVFSVACGAVVYLGVFHFADRKAINELKDLFMR